MLPSRHVLMDPRENAWAAEVNTPSLSQELPMAAPVHVGTSTSRPSTPPFAPNQEKQQQQQQKNFDCHGGLDMDEIDRTMFFTPSERQTVSCGAVTVDLKRGRILSLYNKKLGIAQLPKGRKRIGEGHIEAALRETLEESGVRVRPLPLKVWTRSSVVPTIPTPPASAAPSAVDEDEGGRCGCSSVAGSVSDGSVRAESPVAESVAASPPPAPEEPPLAAAHGEINNKTTNGGGGSQRQRRSPDTDVTSDVFNNEFIGVVRYPDPQSQTPGTLKSIYWYAATFDLDEIRGPGGLDGNREHEKFVVCAYTVRDTIKTLRFRAEKEVVRKLVADLEASGITMGCDDGEGDDGYCGYEEGMLIEGDTWHQEASP